MKIQAKKLCYLVVIVLSFMNLCFAFQIEFDDDDYDYKDDYTLNKSQGSDEHRIQKRPTVLLNRLMYALQNAIQSPEEMINRQHQELQRRGYPKHYWNCYFNAVSCFKRKRQASFSVNS
ncbi:hypothetical protein HNY73_004494 [Argiope bruennichi]|uniref:Uncharacterized protein n=2 Tax=Argiope bruennichi TaxID=94029 RepID=A0A8T0FS01_ARGBR|nr:hypothetical protein HNY73_004494 [Argiope bruennichi]